MGIESAAKRFAVFSIRSSQSGSVWVRAGSAFVNRDGSLNVYLDVLPLDGKLHLREVEAKPADEDSDGDSDAAKIRRAGVAATEAWAKIHAADAARAKKVTP